MVTVEWTKELSVMYTTEVSPMTLSIVSGSTTIIASCQLVLRIQYNTEYNLSVVAVSPCANDTAFITVTLNYGEIYIFICCGVVHNMI